MRKILFLFLIIINSYLWTQSLSISLPMAYNPDITWKKIKTDHFVIIYDNVIEQDAQDIANQIEAVFKSLTNTMGEEIHPFTLVLTAQNVTTNGYVSPINNHSEFFPVPPESSHGTIEWYTSLVLHEGRHMAQFSNIRDSLLQKVTGILMGSNNVVFGALIPLYFFEGDAVLTETLLSESGRGREPSFERELRTILLSGENFSFQKAFYRSKNDYYPNYYVLGYYLMTYLRREYGADVLSRIIDSAANDPFPLNFSRHCYFVTGKTIVTIYNEVMEELKKEWLVQDSTVTKTVTDTLIKSDSKIYTNRLYPQVNRSGDLVYIKSDLDGNSYLYKNDEKHISIYNNFSLYSNKIVYTEKGYDIRWESKGYSDLFIYNMSSRKKEKITDNKRYFYPSFSPDGEKIATIEYGLNRTPSLVIIDSKTASEINKIEFKRGDMLSSPSWDSTGNLVVVSRLTDKGNCIGIVDLNTGTFENVTDYNNISKYSPVFYKNTVLFVSTYSGIENVHAVDLDTREEFQVISSKFGVNFPYVDLTENRLIFSQYHKQGYGIDSYILDRDKWINVNKIERNHVDYFEPLLDQEIPVTKFPDKVFEAEKYNPNTNLIDVHAWLYSPFYSFINKSDVSKDSETFDLHELILFSNDRLGLLQTNLYTHYNSKNNSFDLGTLGSYKGFFPVLSWDINLFFNKAGGNLSTMNISGTLEIPLNFSYQDFGLGLGVTPETFRDFTNSNNSYDNLSYYISYTLSNNEIYYNSKLRFKHFINSGLSPRLELDNNLILNGPVRRSYFIFENINIWSLKDSGYNEEYFKNRINSLIYFREQSDSYVKVNYSHYFSGAYNIPLGYPELSIINWFFLDSMSIVPGYEGAYSGERSLDHIAKISAKVDYRLLRLPIISFYSQFTTYYNFNDSSFNYAYIPIFFSLKL